MEHPSPTPSAGPTPRLRTMSSTATSNGSRPKPSAPRTEERDLVLPFAPRPWQRRLLADRARRIVAVVHRRAGKSTALMWLGLTRALTETKPNPRVVHIL